MDIFPERESLLTNTENSYSFGCIDERVELDTLAADLDVEQSLNRNWTFLEVFWRVEPEMFLDYTAV